MQIVLFFWQLCLLRADPERLPSSTFATAAVFTTYLVIAIGVVVLTRPDQSAGALLGTIAVGVLLQAGVTYLLLQFKGMTSRFRATWSALLGTNAIMLLVLLPFNFILLHVEVDALRMFADSATWICLGWWLAIAGYIYHRAVAISVLQGSAIAFLIELTGVIIAFNLFPR